jgi:hypothetical protein
VDKKAVPTPDDNIPLIPQQISENGVESVGAARDENNFLGPSAEKPGHAMSGRVEVFRET